jgi:fatty-acyl-CoA synthase
MDLSDLIERNAAFTPDKPAIRFAGRVLSYGGLARQIALTAAALGRELGVSRGDRVGILAANHPDYLTLLYACARLGAMLVPVNWRLALPEQLYVLRAAAVKALVLEQAHSAIIAELTAAAPHTRLVGVDFTPPGGASLCALREGASGEGRVAGVDTSLALLLVYTSGTTGRPKGAVLRQEALIWNALMSQHMHDMSAADHVLTVLPMFHVGGLNIQTTPALQLGATVSLHARFLPQAVLAAIQHERPSLLVLVPATMRALIEHPHWRETRMESLRALTTGSTQVPQRLVDAFVERGVPVLQVYGATETAPVAIYTRLCGDWRRPGSAGLPGLACEAKIVDGAGSEVAPGVPGEVIVRGPNVFSEYRGEGQASAAALRDGWYYTGDMATRDAQGYFFIHDRKTNTIISGGENVYPAEVERVLLEHGDIAEAAVIGRAHDKWQEVPVAYLVLRQGARPGAGEIESFCLARLARYKVPREYVFVDTLPRNEMGKVQHFRLRQLASEGAIAAAASTPPATKEHPPDEDRRAGRWKWRFRGGR